ncbi:hypothetical protein [Dongia sp.]|uniref:DUF4376 domain-containing protein n=1 Tax=Dongia sp. TaxID=1977262 RepID=UPI0035B1B55C
MQHYYVDPSGKSIGSYDGPIELSPFAGTPVGIAPDDAGAQRWNGSIWVRPAESSRETILSAIARRYQQALAAGLAHGGKVLQIREQDQANLTAMGNEARWALESGVPWPADFAWRMADNTFLSLATPESMIAMAEAAKAEVFRLRQVKWVHVDAVRAMTIAADIDSYNFETGW